MPGKVHRDPYMAFQRGSLSNVDKVDSDTYAMLTGSKEMPHIRSCIRVNTAAYGALKTEGEGRREGGEEKGEVEGH